jgi:predicted oxidoreductase
MGKICLDCGMSIDEDIRRCPKCDNFLDYQHDGSITTVDIAHQGEKVDEALCKMRAAVDAARNGIELYLRLIVGSGVIRDEVLVALRDLKASGDVKSFGVESSNSGSIKLRLK